MLTDEQRLIEMEGNLHREHEKLNTGQQRMKEVVTIILADSANNWRSGSTSVTSMKLAYVHGRSNLNT